MFNITTIQRQTFCIASVVDSPMFYMVMITSYHHQKTNFIPASALLLANLHNYSQYEVSNSLLIVTFVIQVLFLFLCEKKNYSPAEHIHTNLNFFYKHYIFFFKLAQGKNLWCTQCIKTHIMYFFLSFFF